MTYISPDTANVLYGIARNLLQERDFGELLTNILDMTIQALGADRGCVLAREKDGFHATTARNFRNETLAAREREISTTIAGMAVEEGRVLLVHDALDSAVLRDKKSVRRLRFLFYTVGGTGNPEGWPLGVRWIFEHLPFLGVQTDKVSMQNASPGSKALMWSAGVTASAIIPTLAALCAWRSGIPWSGWFCVFALGWALGTLASNWTSRTGDYSKARRALGRS